MTPLRRLSAPRTPNTWRRKPAGAYHHRDLERALVAAAVRTIREEGVPALTLRGVAARLNVSRTALYRHFPHKAALLASVAREGFLLLYDAQVAALARAAAQGTHPLLELTRAYIRFASESPSHYDTMFGGFLHDSHGYPELVEQASAVFNLLVETIRGEQRRGRIMAGNPIPIAELAWSLSHGIASRGRLWPFTSRASRRDELAVLACTLLQQGTAGAVARSKGLEQSA